MPTLRILCTWHAIAEQCMDDMDVGGQIQVAYSNAMDDMRALPQIATPDFSLYLDMPLPMQRWNEYRRRALGRYWQSEGLNVIPTLSWADERSFGFCLDGLPRHSTVAVSSVGVMGDEAALATWRAGMGEALGRLHPSRVLLYGSDPGYEWPEWVEVVPYAPSGRFE